MKVTLPYWVIIILLGLFLPVATTLLLSGSESNASSIDSQESVISIKSHDNTSAKNPAAWITASSYLSPSYGLSYHPTLIADEDPFTWWSPKSGDAYPWIQVNFNRVVWINTVVIWNGSHYPNFSYNGKYYGNLFYMNRRVIRARLEFSNGVSYLVNFNDIDYYQTCYFPDVATSYVRVVPVYFLPGSKWQDICISELSFY